MVVEESLFCSVPACKLVLEISCVRVVDPGVILGNEGTEGCVRDLTSLIPSSMLLASLLALARQDDRPGVTTRGTLKLRVDILIRGVDFEGHSKT